MKNYLSLVKFSHTIFAMPFACIGFFLASNQQASTNWWLFLKVVFCMVFARSAAMAFNRYVDRSIDQKNPRTAQREIPAGVIAFKCLIFCFSQQCIIHSNDLEHQPSLLLFISCCFGGNTWLFLYQTVYSTLSFRARRRPCLSPYRCLCCCQWSIWHHLFDRHNFFFCGSVLGLRIWYNLCTPRWGVWQITRSQLDSCFFRQKQSANTFKSITSNYCLPCFVCWIFQSI